MFREMWFMVCYRLGNKCLEKVDRLDDSLLAQTSIVLASTVASAIELTGNQ